MKLTDNYFKNNPKKVKKVMLAVKVFIGTIAGAVVFQSPIWSTALLGAGAMIDFIVDIIFNDDENT
jgi:hypothetical protein